MADFVNTCSSSSKVGEAVAASHESVGDYDVVKINNHTEADFVMIVNALEELAKLFENFMTEIQSFD